MITFLCSFVCLKFFFMSFYSIGKNELRNLSEQELKLRKQLDEDSGCGNVCSFKNIILHKELSKLNTKLRVLSYMNPKDDGDDGTA